RSHYLVGEEDAVWLLRLVLPYVNEVLLNLRSLFSGEPATTMKLALLLFAMARCGNFVTLWTLAKLVFFGIFTIPKVCSSYSTQLARYGKFWLERFRDAWESCSHKKAVVAAVFTLVWNVSSTVARVWAGNLFYPRMAWHGIFDKNVNHVCLTCLCSVHAGGGDEVLPAAHDGVRLEQLGGGSR
uniref:Reticulon domain-containing protein n=1 Tax=Aegilops tauschii subsp. strangulata TaxID=200361 RepID=A0A453EIV7_AEGTS